MQLTQSTVPATARRESIHDRVLGPDNTRDDALVFAASSVINEVVAAQYDGSPVVREVRTEHGSYVLKGSRVYAGDTVQPVVIVYAEPVTAEPVTAGPVAEAAPVVADQALRTRYGLTRKEARVAALLASQKSNEDIARELFISPHTARHHTQSVLGKLGVRSRREVAGVLRSI